MKEKWIHLLHHYKLARCVCSSPSDNLTKTPPTALAMSVMSGNTTWTPEIPTFCENVGGDPLQTARVVVGRQHMATWLIAFYLIASCSTRGAGMFSRMLRTPTCGFLGSVALEMFIFSEGLKDTFRLMKLTDDESFYAPYSALLYVGTLVLLAHVVANRVIQPLLSSDVCKGDQTCCTRGSATSSATGSKELSADTSWTKGAAESV